MTQECPICYNIIEKYGFCVTNCEHIFCIDCMVKSLKTNKTCPMCRTIVDKDETPVEETDNYLFGYERGYDQGVLICETDMVYSFRENLREQGQLIKKYNHLKKEHNLTIHQLNTYNNMSYSHKEHHEKIKNPRRNSIS